MEHDQGQKKQVETRRFLQNKKLRLVLNSWGFYWQQIATLVYFSIVWFLLFMVVGFLTGDQGVEMADRIMSEFDDQVAIIFYMPLWGQVIFLLLNNALAVAVTMFGGLVFGLLPLYVLAVNGTVLGIFLHFFATQGRSAFFLWGILPHGVPELLVIFLASAVGLLAGSKVIRRVWWGEEFRVRSALREMVLIFYVLAGVLLAAAMIEILVTPMVLDIFFDTGSLLIE